MSRYETRHSRDTKGHGALGFLVTFVLILFVIVLLFFFFSEDSFKGTKRRIYSYLYPQEYSAQVSRCAREFGVEEPLVYAVIRTESGFRPEVESHAGARGLMQLMPATFDWLQESMNGEIVYDTDALFDPEINIRYGTYLLSILMKQYDNNMPTAVAAYNAGTTTVDGWLEGGYSVDGKTLSTVPYEETEHYVDRVQEAYEMYTQLYY